MSGFWVRYRPDEGFLQDKASFFGRLASLTRFDDEIGALTDAYTTKHTKRYGRRTKCSTSFFGELNVPRRLAGARKTIRLSYANIVAGLFEVWNVDVDTHDPLIKICTDANTAIESMFRGIIHKTESGICSDKAG